MITAIKQTDVKNREGTQRQESLTVLWEIKKVPYIFELSSVILVEIPELCSRLSIMSEVGTLVIKSNS